MIQGEDLTVDDGQYLKLTVSFNRSSSDGNGDGINDSPVLEDITINSANVAPEIASLTVTKMIDENGEVTLIGNFTDPNMSDVHTVEIDWNDPNNTTPTTLTLDISDRTFTATHQYLDDQAFEDGPSPGNDTLFDDANITVMVSDDGGLTGTDSVSTTVNNIEPVIIDVASDATFEDKALPGDTITLNGSFSDVGTLDEHTVTIDWGDGTTAITLNEGDLTITTPPKTSPVNKSFSALHKYVNGGIYTIATTVTDDDTSAVFEEAQAVVTGVRLTLDGELQIVGTNEEDEVEVSLEDGLIEVEAEFGDDAEEQTFTFDLNEVESIVAHLCDGNDEFELDEDIFIPSIVFAGGGNDEVEGGSGDDIIFGGPGKDELEGDSGNDVLVGGEKKDKLQGGEGFDIILGGGGRDKLQGDQGEDVLFGGEALFENDIETLNEVLDIWTNGASFNDRVAALSEDSFFDITYSTSDFSLGMSTALNDDSIKDILQGEEDKDWVIVYANDKVKNLGNNDLKTLLS